MSLTNYDNEYNLKLFYISFAKNSNKILEEYNRDCALIKSNFSIEKLQLIKFRSILCFIPYISSLN